MAEPTFYITSCLSKLCPGGDEFLREDDACGAPCSWCGGPTDYVECPLDNRARLRIYARAEGLGFIQNVKETRFLPPVEESDAD